MISINPRANLFTDENGVPLNGSAYIGTSGSPAGAGNTINVYSNRNLTTIVSQPVAIRNGRFAHLVGGLWVYLQLYADVHDYSITLRDANGDIIRSFNRNPKSSFVSMSSGTTAVNDNLTVGSNLSGQIIRIGATLEKTITLDNAANLEDDFLLGVINTGTGNVKIKGQATETINNVSEISLAPNQSTFISGDGSSFLTLAYSSLGNAQILPYEADSYITFSGTKNEVSIPNLRYKIGDNVKTISSQIINIEQAGAWDTYRNPDYRAGKDFYLQATSGSTIQCSDQKNKSDCRLIGGFHCLSEDVGVISGHALSAYDKGDILPASVWDLYNGSEGVQDGMVKIPTGEWVSIYLASLDGTGTIFQSKYNQNIFLFNDDSHMNAYHIWSLLRLNKCRSISWSEFQVAALGSPENKRGDSVTPQTKTGGRSVGGIRNVSNFGCEDMTGIYFQLGRGEGILSDSPGYVNAFIASEPQIAGATPRGQSIKTATVPKFGGDFEELDDAKVGSRCSSWATKPEEANEYCGVRFVCRPRRNVF